MRVVDAVLAIPLIITALVAITAVGPSRKTLVLVIGFVFTPIIAKTVRAAVLGEARLEYVQAARLRNEHGPYVMFAEILPNVTGPIIVEFTVRLGYAIFTVATLAFLGFAADPTVPDWGQDISAHYPSINARLLVAGPLPLPRHRDAHRRHQPDRRCRRAALRADERPRHRAPGPRDRLPRAWRRPARAPRRFVRDRPGRVVRARRRVRLREDDRGLRDHALPPAQREDPRAARSA